MLHATDHEHRAVGHALFDALERGDGDAVAALDAPHMEMWSNVPMPVTPLMPGIRIAMVGGPEGNTLEFLEQQHQVGTRTSLPATLRSRRSVSAAAAASRGRASGWVGAMRPSAAHCTASRSSWK